MAPSRSWPQAFAAPEEVLAVVARDAGQGWWVCVPALDFRVTGLPSEAEAEAAALAAVVTAPALPANVRVRIVRA